MPYATSSSAGSTNPPPSLNTRRHVPTSSSSSSPVNTSSTATGHDTISSVATQGPVLRSRTGKKNTSAAGSQLKKNKRGNSTAVGGGEGGAGEGAASIPQVDGQQHKKDNSSLPTSDMPTLPPSQTPHPKWVLLALLSGAFAAMNGVFAKLTTSSDTPPGASVFTHILPFLDPTVIQVILRSIFFGLNLASNAVMWVLFTRALTSHPSTTKVAVVNTSANFALTAVMGALIFHESVGGLGGVAGLALLVGGCVVLGAQKEKVAEGEGGDDGQGGAESAEEGAVEAPYTDEDYDAATEVATEVDAEDLIDLQDDIKRSQDPGPILDGTESDEETEIR